MLRLTLVCVLVGFTLSVCRAQDEPLFKETLNVTVPNVSTDPSLKLDYDIVYVRADRAGDKVHKRFYTDFMEFEDVGHLLNGKADEEQISDFLRNGIENLKEEQRNCIELFYFENKSYQEICSYTGYSIMQVKSFLQNGKRNLKINLQHRYGK